MQTPDKGKNKTCSSIYHLFSECNLLITKKLDEALLLTGQKLGDEVFRFLLPVVLGEPLGHDVGGLLPMLHHLLEVLLTLQHT